MVDVGHAIDHTGIVLPEYGGNAIFQKVPAGIPDGWAVLAGR